MVKLIKTEGDYQEALARIEKLMDAEPGTPEGEELELLAALVEMYEDKHFLLDLPDPVEAIKFRMDQAGLTRKDLVSYIGGKSKVSEVLNGKRPLTLSMMRALNKHLGIPAEVLLKESGAEFPDEIPEIEWTRFPLKEMARLGWIDQAGDLKTSAEEIIRGFIIRASGKEIAPQPLFRKKEGGRRNAKTDNYALAAWCLRVLELARAGPLPNKYKPGTVDNDFLGRVAKLSFFGRGPLLAKEFLAKHGVHLIVVPHLQRTYLDGAVMLLPDGAPVVALTLRYDRVDNFWFNLLHELAHVGRHLSPQGEDFFVDDMSLRKHGARTEDPREREADEWAEEALIPSGIWAADPAKRVSGAAEVRDLAEKLEIHPAIIAGRIRYEQNNYRLLSRFVGQGQIREYFSGVPTSAME